jgi:hypothetical protein
MSFETGGQNNSSRKKAPRDNDSFLVPIFLSKMASSENIKIAGVTLSALIRDTSSSPHDCVSFYSFFDSSFHSSKMKLF